MKKQHSSIDGFIPRRPDKHAGSLGDSKKNKKHVNKIESKDHFTNESSVARGLEKKSVNHSYLRSDIGDSIDDIDSFESIKKLNKRQLRQDKKRHKKQFSLVRSIVKIVLFVSIFAAVSVGAYTAYQFIVAGNNVFNGSILDVFNNEPLKMDSNGRSNFLVLGTSEDDAGHDGADLTDSMLVVSVDQNKKNIYMFSIPRDLYVEYGEACPAGYSGKINSYFSCSDTGITEEAEQNRFIKTQKLIGDIFGLDIQYSVHVNHTVIKQAVDAVGGIDVDVQGSNGDPGVLDRNFDWRCDYKCYLVKYDNGIHHLDGEQALNLAMARGHSAPTYGLGNSNFDREINQQKILMALKDKAMSTGTLTNIGSVTKLIGALGDNLRTNIQTNELRTLMKIGNDVTASSTQTIKLFGDDDNSVVTTGMYNGASVVMPSAGIFDYSDIIALIKKNLTNDPIIKEEAPLIVLNGTGQPGFGKTKADILIEKGFNVTSIDNAPEGTYDAVEVYQIGTGNEATAAKLSSLYNITIKREKPPVLINGDIRFIVIFGSNS